MDRAKAEKRTLKNQQFTLPSFKNQFVPILSSCTDLQSSAPRVASTKKDYNPSGSSLANSTQNVSWSRFKMQTRVAAQQRGKQALQASIKAGELNGKRLNSDLSPLNEQSNERLPPMDMSVTNPASRPTSNEKSASTALAERCSESKDSQPTKS